MTSAQKDLADPEVLWDVHRETGEPLDADELALVVQAGLTDPSDWEDRGGGLYWHAPTWPDPNA